MHLTLTDFGKLVMKFFIKLFTLCYYIYFTVYELIITARYPQVALFRMGKYLPCYSEMVLFEMVDVDIVSRAYTLIFL